MYKQEIILYMQLQIPGTYVIRALIGRLKQDSILWHEDDPDNGSVPGDRCNHANGFSDYSGSGYRWENRCFLKQEISMVSTSLARIGWFATSNWSMIVTFDVIFLGHMMMNQ